MQRRRRLWIILLATPLMLLAADTLYWWIVVSNLEHGFGAWEAAQRAAGWTEQHGPAVRSGWPLAATLTVPAMSIAGGNPSIPGGLAWTADRLVLRVALPQPQSLEIMPEGRQRLRLAGYAEIPFTADRTRLVFPLPAAPWPGSMELVTDNLRADTPIGGDASVQSLRLHLDFSPDAQSGEPAVTFSLKTEMISPPSGIVRPFGPRIANLELDGTLSGPVPVGHTPAEQAAAWRDGGGSLEIQHLAVVWGPLDLTASATLALDDQLQPMGAGSARLVGYAETLDALTAHAAISRSAATATKAVLSLLAHNPEDGSPPDVEVPLTLQYRTLSMRQVPLVRLPEVDWP
ncbi:MAG TPA: DUF2125 domain-containing protein [Acetobacteraceae bacterium]|nr:DUF2125 domain-containing protein [Acetobacteraceae bacterium]